MLFDTDVLIWCLRGNRKAATVIDDADDRFLSVITYMELLQGSKNASESKSIRAFLADCGFATVSLSANIGHRAAIYMEEYGLSVEMGVADALIAATAAEEQLVLCTGNGKHYKPVKDVSLKIFKP